MAKARLLLIVSALGTLALVAATPAQEAFPGRNVSIVVPLQSGTASDLVARVLADKLTVKLGRPVLVENVVGTGGAIGAQRLARSKPDGHTVGAFNNGVQTILPQMGSGGAPLQFDPMKDIVPITLLARFPSVLIVDKDLPIKSLHELIALSNQEPGRLNYASVGIGSPQHLAMEELKSITGMNLNHVPYRGGAQAVTAVVAGEVNVFWIATSVALPFIRSGKVRAVAVGERARTKMLPDVPTVRELGLDYEYSPWLALYAPAGSPDAIRERLRKEVTEVLLDVEAREKLAAAGIEAQASTAQEVGAMVAEESDRMTKVISQLGLKQ
jgi:tripartite-type tricarboxylate transporter receptor subunit TctC